MKNDRKKLSKAGFDRDASGYDQSTKYAAVRAGYRSIADEALRSKFKTWLDIGCGTGAFLLMLGQQIEDAKLFGIDLSDQMIKVARTKLGEKADLRVSDSEELPFENEQFDLITCTYSFHHYPNPVATLMEMRRVLSPTGRIIIADPTIFAPLRQIINLLVPAMKDGTVRCYSKKEMRHLVESVGLVVSKWSKLNWHQYMMVCGRGAQ